jgi:GT2 family glycosyltransferase
MSDVAVAVLNWNGVRWLQGCFESLLNNVGITFDPWLIDNGSTDESLAFMKERFPSVHVLALDKNRGFGAAYNRAMEKIQADWVVLLNNDTVVEPGWLAALVEGARRDPDAAAVGSKLLYMDRPRVLNHAGGKLTPLGAAFDIGFGCPDGPDFDCGKPIGCASGAAMLIRRDAFFEVGGFDEHYFVYFEDADLCWRFWLRGYHTLYQPAARALHAYGGTNGGGFGRLGDFRVRHCQTNRLQNMFKHLEMRTLLWAVPASLAYDSLRLVTAMRAGQRIESRALVRGSRAFARLMPAVLQERARLQRLRVASDDDLIKIGALATLPEAATEWRRLANLSAA